MRIDGATIAQATGGRLLRDAPAGPVLTDTRALEPGAWFLAIQGGRFDGHDFLGAAAEAGAAGCIVTHAPDDWSGGIVVVEDTTRALQDLGRWARDQIANEGGKVVGLTGSSGKTTTRALIALACQQAGHVHQTVGNLNNHWGVPMTLLAAPRHADVVVVEMGTSSPGEIAVLADIARPDARLVVNVGPAHLEELGGLEGVAREKGALLRSARPGDAVCINVDDPHLVVMSVPEHANKVTWGMAPESDIRLVEAVVDELLHTEASFETPMGRVDTRIPAPGVHIAHDAGGALAVAWALGLDLHRAALDLQKYEAVGMRMRLEALPKGAKALNDAYNANPSSMKAALTVLSALPGRRAAVLGDMLELGADEAVWHQRVVRQASALGLDLMVLVGPRMAAAASAGHGPKVWTAVDPADIVQPLREWLRAGDHVLFKGSRGARVERVLHALQENPGDS